MYTKRKFNVLILCEMPFSTIYGTVREGKKGKKEHKARMCVQALPQTEQTMVVTKPAASSVAEGGVDLSTRNGLPVIVIVCATNWFSSRLVSRC